MLTRDALRSVAGPPVRRPWLCDVEFHALLLFVLLASWGQVLLADAGRAARPQGAGWIVVMVPLLLVVALAVPRWWRPRWTGPLAVAGMAVCLVVTFGRYAVPEWRHLFSFFVLFPFPLLLTAAVRRAGPVAAPLAVAGGLVAVLAWGTVRLHVPGSDPAQIDRGIVIPLGDVALTVLVVLGPIALGGLLRIADQRRRAAELSRLRADERLQVARELHDLIARHVTGMTMYAQAITVMPGVPDQALRALGSIGTAGEDALAAMHRMVRVLRSDTDPGLRSLDALPTSATDLVGAVQSAVGETDGVVVRIAPPLRGAAVPADTLGTVHRVVAEALTNVRRHAPRAREIGVELGVPDPGRMSVEVSNDDAGRGGARGGGFGLAGLAERVEALGGSVRVGPAGPGRWVLRAELPWTPAAEPARSAPVTG